MKRLERTNNTKAERRSLSNVQAVTVCLRCDLEFVDLMSREACGSCLGRCDNDVFGEISFGRVGGGDRTHETQVTAVRRSISPPHENAARQSASVVDMCDHQNIIGALRTRPPRLAEPREADRVCRLGLRGETSFDRTRKTDRFCSLGTMITGFAQSCRRENTSVHDTLWGNDGLRRWRI